MRLDLIKVKQHCRVRIPVSYTRIRDKLRKILTCYDPVVLGSSLPRGEHLTCHVAVDLNWTQRTAPIRIDREVAWGASCKPVGLARGFVDGWEKGGKKGKTGFSRIRLGNKVLGEIVYSHQIALSLTEQEGQGRLRKSTLRSSSFFFFWMTNLLFSN